MTVTIPEPAIGPRAVAAESFSVQATFVLLYAETMLGRSNDEAVIVSGLETWPRGCGVPSIGRVASSMADRSKHRNSTRRRAILRVRVATSRRSSRRRVPTLCGCAISRQ